METRRFCVYNQTCECFLSFGVTAADAELARFKDLIGKRTLKDDAGIWMRPPKGFHQFNGVPAAPMDLVYLDKNHRVVHTVESVSRARNAASRKTASSLLALPVHTVYSSQTQPGNQLVICPVEELEFRLRNVTAQEEIEEKSVYGPGAMDSLSLLAALSCDAGEDRRRSGRQIWPPLVAYDASGGNLAVHGIRDASATGLYLITERRWPLGTRMTMTLQRADIADEKLRPSIAVQLEVIRWARDGVGVRFILPETLMTAPWTETMQAEAIPTVAAPDVDGAYERCALEDEKSVA
jgi:uncharacterized membrane protein (UPF0127 family)